MDVQELRAAMKKIGFQLNDVEVDTMARLMDNDNSGEIDFEEFMGCVMFAQAMKKGVPLEQVGSHFSVSSRSLTILVGPDCD